MVFLFITDLIFGRRLRYDKKKPMHAGKQYSMQNKDHLTSFQAPEAVAGAKAFACKLMEERNAE